MRHLEQRADVRLVRHHRHRLLVRRHLPHLQRELVVLCHGCPQRDDAVDCVYELTECVVEDYLAGPVRGGGVEGRRVSKWEEGAEGWEDGMWVG